jgi:retron-type reverse transcriptase
MRLLVIPTVRDRIVQQALLTILQPIFDKYFYSSSYGYRPKQSCHDAVNNATLLKGNMVGAGSWIWTCLSALTVYPMS